MTRLRQMFDPYIALMLVTVVLATILPAAGRGAVIAGGAANAGIIFLFFLYGTRLSLKQAWEGLRQWRLQAAVLASTFILVPILGLGLSFLIPPILPGALVTGFIFFCVVPSTGQASRASTSIARCNFGAAI